MYHGQILQYSLFTLITRLIRGILGIIESRIIKATPLPAEAA